MPNNDKLTIILDTDLSYKQSVDILITGSQLASQNKKLDIYINSSTLSTNTTEALIIGDLDLPVCLILLICGQILILILILIKLFNIR